MTLFESAVFGLVLAALVVKPSELPPLARRLGRTAGRAVNRFQSMKQELSEYVEKNELRSVHDEFEQTMGQLNKIRQDVRSVSSVRGMMMEFASAPGRDGRDSRNGSGGRRVDDQSLSNAPVGRGETGKPKGLHEPDEERGATMTVPYTVLPVSARDVQRARSANTIKSNDSIAANESDEATGSGLLRAALEEERVAKTAAQFFSRGNEDQ